jgi:hypothetical protein
MAYFGDILEDNDKRMDYEVEKPEKLDDIKMLTLKLKSAPTKNVNLSNGVDMVRKGDNHDMKHKTEIKYKCSAENSTKWTFSNKDFGLEWNFAPEQLNKDGMHGELEVETKCNPVKAEWEAKAEFKTGGFELGPITPWLEVSINLYLIPYLVPI